MYVIRDVQRSDLSALQKLARELDTVNLPDDDIVYDLANGPIRVGALVNVTALPGATFEVSNG